MTCDAATDVVRQTSCAPILRAQECTRRRIADNYFSSAVRTAEHCQGTCELPARQRPQSAASLKHVGEKGDDGFRKCLQLRLRHRAPGDPAGSCPGRRGEEETRGSGFTSTRQDA